MLHTTSDGSRCNITIGLITIGLITSGRITIGLITIGRITIGQITIGRITIGQITIGWITIGQITTGQTCNFLRDFLLFEIVAKNNVWSKMIAYKYFLTPKWQPNIADTSACINNLIEMKSNCSW
jgi:hypothetical protein